MAQNTPTTHGDVVVITDQSALLRTGGPAFIQGYRVEIHGAVSSRGQSVTIVANELVFVAPDAQIDTSAVSGPNDQIPVASKPQTPPMGGMNQPGNNGANGVAGAPGIDAGSVKIYAGTLTGVLNVKATGSKGGRGGDGGDGSMGGPRPLPTAEPGDDCVGTRGATGTRGGNAGQAGSSGKAGNGGNVDLYLLKTASASQPPFQVTLQLDGGPRADTATPGNPGPGGLPGLSPACSGHPEPGRPLPTGHAGQRGPAGSPAPPQVAPSPSIAGFFCGKPPNTTPPPFYAVSDQAFAGQCSAQQLWDVLQSAEALYLNEDFANAAARLTWVSMIGRQLGQ